MEFQTPALFSPSPKSDFTQEGLEAYVEVQNFGQITFEKSRIAVSMSDKVLASRSVRQLKPFETSLVRLACFRTLLKGSKHEMTVALRADGLPTETFTKTIRLLRHQRPNASLRHIESANSPEA